MPKPPPLSFFRRPADVVAPELLGCTLIVHQQRRSSALPAIPALSATITEVEAYLGTADPASHVWKGRRTPTIENLYAPPGSWYVYKSHGLHWCCNLTTLGKEEGHAVLLRGVLTTDARTLEVFRRRRGPKVLERNLSDGPGKMTQALGIDISLDGVPMAGSMAEIFRPARSERSTKHDAPVLITPRIGLTRAVDWPLRWVVK
jgi:DNA-3-methyladenine glycosylase